jgi:molybdopterin-guanine dinucleotide biosynthesis protein A
MERARVTGLLLAGGRSRRMFEGGEAVPGETVGSGDKCLLALANGTVLSHVVARLRPQVGRIVLNANGDPSRFTAYGLPVVADGVTGYAGPLAGILAGMRWSLAHAPEATHVVSVSTDAPFLPLDLVPRLAAGLAEAGGAIAIASSAGHLHPVIGSWPVALADDLERALVEGLRKVLAWTDRHGTVPVPFPLWRRPEGEIDPFFNVNTPQDLAEARRIAEAWTP